MELNYAMGSREPIWYTRRMARTAGARRLSSGTVVTDPIDFDALTPGERRELFGGMPVVVVKSLGDKPNLRTIAEAIGRYRDEQKPTRAMYEDKARVEHDEQLAKSQADRKRAKTDEQLAKSKTTIADQFQSNVVKPRLDEIAAGEPPKKRRRRKKPTAE